MYTIVIQYCMAMHLLTFLASVEIFCINSSRSIMGYDQKDMQSVGEIGTVNQILSEKFYESYCIPINLSLAQIADRQVSQNQGKIDGGARRYHQQGWRGCGSML